MSTPENFNGPAATGVSPAAESAVPFPETPALPGLPEPSVLPPPRKKWTSTTSLLLIANTLIFLAMVAYNVYDTGWEKFLNTPIAADFDPEIWLKWGSDFGPFTLTGQFWRAITSIFLHKNFVHLGWNMLFLWGLGRYLDRLFTRWQAFAIFLLTGVSGSIFSLAWHPVTNSAGASGAIYGQAGVLIALLCFARLKLPRRDIRNILLWIIFAMPIELLWSPLSKHTDYAGHIGGMLGGLVIGVLLALTFRRPIDRASRQNGVLRFATVVLVIIFAAVAQARREVALKYLNAQNFISSSRINYPNRPPKLARVFLDLKGDPKLVRYFSSLLRAELENDGITVTNSAAEADAVVHGEIHAQIEHTNLGLGVIRMQIDSQHDQQKIDSCASLSTDAEGNFFDQIAAGNAAERARTRYPDARTVRLDPESDMAASSQFADELPSKLKKSGFTVVQSGPADIALHIALLPQKVSIEEDEAAYDIRVVAQDGAPLYEFNGSAVLFAKLAGPAPAACPERVTDLKWIYNTNTFYSIVKDVASDLYAPPEPSVHQKPSKPKS